MKDGCLSKLIITKSSNRATQYKKVVDALLVCCADKGYWYINDIVHTNTELQEAAFLLSYLLAVLWSNTYHVQIETVDSIVIPDAHRAQLPITEMVEKTHVFNSNFQKQLLADYN